MTEQDALVTVRRLYRLTGSISVIGFVSYFAVQGVRPALAFALGALGSFGNLWLFEWLSRNIAPGDNPRKPWQAGAFVMRYLVLFACGYVIVKALDVKPLAVILGLLTSTVAVLASIIIELFQHFLPSRPSH